MATVRTTITPSGSVITTDVTVQTTPAPDGVILNATLADITAPLLTLASVDTPDHTTVTVRVTTNEGGGTLWRILHESPLKPSVGQIQAGQEIGRAHV